MRLELSKPPRKANKVSKKDKQDFYDTYSNKYYE